MPAAETKFEDQVKHLCAQALAAHDEAEVRMLLGRVRSLFHEQIEQLRRSLPSAYSADGSDRMKSPSKAFSREEAEKRPEFQIKRPGMTSGPNPNLTHFSRG